MKKIKKVIILIILVLVLVNIKRIDAYGFGVKKNDKHLQPDIGIYKNILEKNGGLYVGDKDSKTIYLTFDCGYENGYTNRVLDVLENHNVKATFFITGHYINSASDIVLRMKEDGHVIGNHSNLHKDITKLSDKEIVKEITDLEQKYYNLTGSNLDHFYRPPAGSFDERSLGVVNSLGYKTLFWSLAYKDWTNDNETSYVLKEITTNIHNGAIILMHTVSEANAKVLDEVILTLKRTGYSFDVPNNLI